MYPSGEDDGASQSMIAQLAIIAFFCYFVCRRTIQVIHDFKEKMQRTEVVPGFPSRPNPHWLVGHLMVLRGADEQVIEKMSCTDDQDSIETAEVSSSFVRGYKRVFCDYADPETGWASFWFFSIPYVSLLRGRDAKKVMCSSSFRKQMCLINSHTRQLLGNKTLLSLMNAEWRYFRNAIHRSFTPEVVKQSRPYIYRIGNRVVDSLLAKIAQNDSSMERETEAESMSDDDDSVDETDPFSRPFVTEMEFRTTNTIHILPLMKMITIDAFGFIALRSNGVDFGCTRDLELSPVASAFDHLTTDYTFRLKRPWDPTSFLYSLPTKANRDYRRKRRMIREFITEQIRQTRARIVERRNMIDHVDGGKEENDFLTNLVSAADSEKAGSLQKVKPTDKAHDDALGDVLMTLLFAGYDTTSIALTYALYLLAKNPIKKLKCLAEVDAVLGSSGSDTNQETTGNTVLPGPEELPYTKAVILESLRLFPPAPATARTITKPTTIGGGREGGDDWKGKNTSSTDKTVTLTKGTMVMIPIWSIQRSELNYPRPNEMIPERWVRRKTETKNVDCNDTSMGNQGRKPETSLWEVRPVNENTKGVNTTSSGVDSSSSDHNNTELRDDDETSIPPANRDAFCAFSAGARNCVGKNLAIEESVILLATLMHKLSFELVSKSYVIVPSLHAIMQQPDDDLPMIVRPRQRKIYTTTEN